MQWLASRTLQRTLAGITPQSVSSDHKPSPLLHAWCFVTAKEEESEQRVFTRAKSNISLDGGGFHYTIQETGVPDRIGNIIKATRVVWGDAVEGNARSILLVIEGEFIKAVRESQFLFASDPSILKLLDEMNTNAFCRKGILGRNLSTHESTRG